MLHSHPRPIRPSRGPAARALLFGGLSLACLVVACRNTPDAGDAAGSGYEGARAFASARGAELYADHCALCHGYDGAGNGPAAPLLFPPARDFGKGLFRLVSSVNAVPSDADLAGVLRRGMPGSAMPSFAWMPDEDVAALVGHVRELAVEGLAGRLETRVAPDWQPLAPDAALRVARGRLEPGSTLAVPPPVAPTPEGLARGRELYLRNCAVCHGEQGEGRPGEPRWNLDGNLNWARDFTAGVLKGGASHDALAHRVLLGMPGTAMLPTVPAEPADVAELVAYVQSLIPAGAEERLVHRAQDLRAASTPAPLPIAGDDAAWAAAEEVEVVLAPLAWHPLSVRSASVAALHDGLSLAVRVRWDDATRDDHIGGASRYGDGVSLALTSAPTPPLIGMGSPEHPVNLWHWKSFHSEDASGVLDVLGPHRRTVPLGPDTAVLDAPLYLPTPETAESLHAEGFERLAPDHALATGVQAAASWSAGQWTVVFTRPLAARTDEEVPLLPGAPVLFSVAAWNGSADDRHGRKSFSIWQRLELD